MCIAQLCIKPAHTGRYNFTELKVTRQTYIKLAFLFKYKTMIFNILF